MVGDEVLWMTSEDEGTIEKILPRRNLFYRQDEIRTKSFAANLDQVLVLIAAEPEFSENQLCRALIAAEAEKIRPVIAVNKADLAAPFNQAWSRLSPYVAMGYTVLPLALNPRNANAVQTPSDTLMQVMHNKRTLVLGPSGSGKSTLINRLLPNAGVLTNEISQALNSGKHTTTSTSLYWVGEGRNTAVLDSPGFQEFGLHHIDPMHLAGLMPDIKAHTDNCRFYNCTHLHEPGCGVISNIESASNPFGISARRYRLYSELFAELSQSRY